MRSVWGLFLVKQFHVGCLGAIAARRALCLLAALLMPALVTPAAAQESYRLGAGDQVAIRLLAWNSLDLRFELFDALGGTYQVDGDGTVNLPLLGLVKAEGLDVATLSAEIGERYRSRLGLTETPSAAVEMVRYRPVYILGDVARPGRYEYEPGLTAIRALALAGGIYRLTDGQFEGAGAAIRAAGTLEELAEDLARERMRAARLQAEMAGAAAFERPDLPPHPDGDTAQQSLFDQERGLFEDRRQQLERALSSIEETRDLLRTEITALEEKRRSIAGQVELVRKSVGDMESLRERGLARSPALIALQQTLIDLEARELDTETGIFRARQQMSELDRDAGDLQSARRLEILREAQAADSEIQRMQTRQTTAARLLAGSESLLSGAQETIQVQLGYSILREEDSGRTRLPADEASALQPLDVLEVEAVTVAQ